MARGGGPPGARAPPPARSRALLAVQVQDGEKGLLRHLDRAELAHPLLALLLLFEQLALAGDVAAVALRDHVLAPSLDRLPGDHAGADHGLAGHVEELAPGLLRAAGG